MVANQRGHCEPAITLQCGVGLIYRITAAKLETEAKDHLRKIRWYGYAIFPVIGGIYVSFLLNTSPTQVKGGQEPTFQALGWASKLH